VPIYRYRCPVHGEFEVTQSAEDKPLLCCTKEVGDYEDDISVCGETVQKLISGSGSFILKGRGFYSNDSKPKNN